MRIKIGTDYQSIFYVQYEYVHHHISKIHGIHKLSDL